MSDPQLVKEIIQQMLTATKRCVKVIVQEYPLLLTQGRGTIHNYQKQRNLKIESKRKRLTIKLFNIILL